MVLMVRGIETRYRRVISRWPYQLGWDDSRTSLACSRVNRGRVGERGRGPSVETAAAAAAVIATTSGSVMFVA